MQMNNPDAISAHASNVALWREMSETAAAGYPAPLTEAERQAYMLLPYLQDQCKESYAKIPVGTPGRPQHYLMAD